MEFECNMKNIKDSISQAKAAGAVIRLGPELEVTGYGCEYHFLELDTITHAWEYLKEFLLGDWTDGILCSIGMPVIKEAERYNCQVLCMNRRIIMIRPKLALGINFTRDGMAEENWISLIAVHSDSWLISVAFYFGARFSFDKNERMRLFQMINDLPTIYEVVTGKANQSKDQSGNSGRSKSSGVKARQSESQTNKASKSSPPAPPPREETLLAENEKLKNLDVIVKKFMQLTTAHRGDVKVLVTTVMPLPPAEEKELKETLQEITGVGKKVTVEQKPARQWETVSSDITHETVYFNGKVVSSKGDDL
ncbi:hypothetical protein Bca52824_000975 [Brassica carinata]|uniref:NAD(+) synthase [glutamine-hydrolyzing] n=1 Tax=Brassica carinata TaxID=52824 RepID=A0A8X7WIG8_BRACI|nr:hypothetical protein Bca52824_000975 [Brassica carinata]